MEYWNRDLLLINPFIITITMKFMNGWYRWLWLMCYYPFMDAQPKVIELSCPLTTPCHYLLYHRNSQNYFRTNETEKLVNEDHWTNGYFMVYIFNLNLLYAINTKINTWKCIASTMVSKGLASLIDIFILIFFVVIVKHQNCM